jgi:hypothetical protein
MKNYWLPALIIVALLGHAALRMATTEWFVFSPSPVVSTEFTNQQQVFVPLSTAAFGLATAQQPLTSAADIRVTANR